ncbi:MAG: hypothetical protein PHU59_03565 [Candidatus Omnitrophica bacterium]|nr:hypothetical protein [Candidatus Omnitrophota bacterium]
MKKHIIILGAALVFIFVIVLFSIIQTAKLNKEYADLTIEPVSSAPALVSRPALVPSRPEDYGMVVSSSSTPVLTQGYWDDLIAKKVKYLKENAPKEVLAKVEEKIKEDPVKVQENLQLVEDNIKKYNAALAANPNDQEAQDRLERFLIYKSIAKELPQEK